MRLARRFHSPMMLNQVWQSLDSLDKPSETKFILTVQQLITLGLLKEKITPPDFIKPIFIVAAPRSGSTLLFETLSNFKNLWTLGGESHFIENIPKLHPKSCGYHSNRLTQQDLTPQISLALRRAFTEKLCDREGLSYLQLPLKQRPQQVRFLEKTPKNALRIPFLQALFPDALFIHLQREVIANISSIIEGWRSQKFVTYPNLPGWYEKSWSFLLPPGWSALKGSAIAEIATYQWQIANDFIEQDLEALPESSWCRVHYEELVANPQQVIAQIAEFVGLKTDQHLENVLASALPLSRYTLSPPNTNKWRKHQPEIAAILEQK